MSALTSSDGGVTVELETGWVAGPAPDGIELLAVCHPTEGSTFAATAVVTDSDVAGLDVVDWSNLTIATVGAQLSGLLLLDDVALRWQRQEGRLVLSSYFDDDGRSLTLQQWFAVCDGRGIALAMTCATEDFPRFREQNQRLAASLVWRTAQ